jgi:hypothetical protein
MGTRFSVRKMMAPDNNRYMKTLEQISTSATASGYRIVFQTAKGFWYTFHNLTDVVNHFIYLATQYPRDLIAEVEPNVAPGKLVLARIYRARQVLAPPNSSESSDMGVSDDNGIPKVKFPPKPDGWKGDPGNPNFKTLGTLSPPVMRKIEPAGPHFLAFARRVSDFNHLLR